MRHKETTSIELRSHLCGLACTKSVPVETESPVADATVQSSSDIDIDISLDSDRKKEYPYLKGWLGQFGMALYLTILVPFTLVIALTPRNLSGSSLSAAYGYLAVEPTVAFGILAVFVLVAFTLSESFTRSSVAVEDLGRYQVRTRMLWTVGMTCHIISVFQIIYLAYGFTSNLVDWSPAVSVLAIIAAEITGVIAIWRQRQVDLERMLHQGYVAQLKSGDAKTAKIVREHLSPPEENEPGLVMRSAQLLAIFVITTALEYGALNLTFIFGLWTNDAPWWRMLLVSTLVTAVLTVSPVLFILWLATTWWRVDLGKARIVIVSLILILTGYTVISFIVTVTDWKNPLPQLSLFLVPLIAAALLLTPMMFPLRKAQMIASSSVRFWNWPLYVAQETLRLWVYRSETKRHRQNLKAIQRLEAKTP